MVQYLMHFFKLLQILVSIEVFVGDVNGVYSTPTKRAAVVEVRPILTSIATFQIVSLILDTKTLVKVLMSVVFPKVI